MRKSYFTEVLFTLPSLLWLSLFFLIPVCIIFLYAFKPAGIYGNIESGWTFETLLNLNNFSFYKLFWRTLWVSSSAAMISLIIALPMGYQIAASTPKWRHLALMMIVIPFWSSFLIRIFAWKTILHPEGIFQKTLQYAGIISESTPLLYSNFAVILVMVYTFLPFALLPIYTAAIKFDFQLIEAAMDLGSSRFKAITNVFIPGIKKGIVAAGIMVFIPAFGTYVIPDLVGGINSELIGNKIAQKTFVERNIPQACAISLILAIGTLGPVAILAIYARKFRSYIISNRNRE